MKSLMSDCEGPLLNLVKGRNRALGYEWASLLQANE